MEEVETEQYADDDLSRILKYVQEGCVASCDEKSKALRPLRNLMDNVRKLKLCDGVLLRISGGRSQIVLPKVYRYVMLKKLHESMGHAHRDNVFCVRGSIGLSCKLMWKIVFKMAIVLFSKRLTRKYVQQWNCLRPQAYLNFCHWTSFT